MSDVPPQPPYGSAPPPPPSGGSGYPPQPPGGSGYPPPPPGGGYPPPPAGGGYSPPPSGGYQQGTPYGQPGYPGPVGAGGWQGPPPAEYGQRVIAYLIDAAIPFAAVIVVVIVGLILSAIVRPLGLLVLFAGYAAVFVYSFWNLAYRQGTTGQSIGKQQQGISLLKEETGQPLGFGMALVRYLVAGAISGVTCGVVGLLDLLWPLWDEKKQRLTDKILHNVVVQTQKAPIDVNTFNPFQK